VAPSSGKDALIVSQTGSGKTLSFLVPLLVSGPYRRNECMDGFICVWLTGWAGGGRVVLAGLFLLSGLLLQSDNGAGGAGGGVGCID
jgi:hypothetical protein